MATVTENAEASASTSTLTPTLAEPQAEGSTSTLVPPKAQAGPLPAKRGEIGFVEGLHSGEGNRSREDVASVAPLPERHPADRDAPPPADAPHAEAAPPPPAETDAASTHSASSSMGKRSLLSLRALSFLRPKRIPLVAGVRLTTLLLFLAQLALAGGTLAGWVVATLTLNSNARRQSDQSQSQSADNTGAGIASSNIFIHVVFAIALLAQLLFLERRVFRLRAERYMHAHPGAALPSSYTRRAGGGFYDAGPSMGLAPWARPPLPTYAAALAQSGHGTGDVEDHLIAAPPPPAYGNTRGSTLLLRNSLPRRSAGAGSLASGTASIRRAGGPEMDERGRPVSYKSVDSGWEIICDADRALRLESTLAQLEEGARR